MKILRLHNLVTFWKKITSGSTNRKIFGAAMIIALLTAMVKVVAVIKELIVAWKFGTNDELDAFLIAFVVPSFIINVIAGSFSSALIPTYIQLKEVEGKKASQKLLSGVMIWGLALLTITTIIMVLTAPLYLPHIARGFDRQKLNLTYSLLRSLAPLVILEGIILIWGAVLNAGERFALAAFTPILAPLITIALLLGVNSWGSFTLVIGLILGAAIQIIILGIALKKQRMSLFPKWYGLDPHLRQVTRQYLPIVAGSLLMCSTAIVDQSMAAMLSPGSVAALSYGNRVIALPITLTTTALSTAVIPYFSKMIAGQNWNDVRHTLKNYLWLIFVVTIPLTVIFMVFSEQIVRILFQRGSFTASDTNLVANIQVFYAFQIPFYIASILVVRLISAMRINHVLVWGSALNLIINIIGNYYFMHWFGVKGIALSTSCVYLVSFIYLFYVGSNHLNFKLKAENIID